MDNLNSNIPAQQNHDDETIDLGKLFFKFLHNWYWFVLTLIIAVGGAYTYLRYTTPVYQMCTSLLMEDEKSSSPALGGIGADASVFQGLGLMGSMRNIHNQMVILKSTPIVERTINELDFDVSYYSIGRITKAEKYNSTPFEIIWDKDHQQIIDAEFFLTINSDGSLNLSLDKEKARVYNYKTNSIVTQLEKISFFNKYKAADTIKSDYYSFKILLNKNYIPNTEAHYSFKFNSPKSLIKKYKNALEINILNKEASIIQISLKDVNVEKGISFLNKLTEVYQIDNLNKKNENANRTIQFISNQLQNISDSLIFSESRMEEFQSENQLLDVSVQSEQLLEQMRELDKEKVALETQNNYYHYLNDYINQTDIDDTETIIAPSAMGIQDPLLNSLILSLNELINTKASQTSIRQNSQHPTIIKLNAQIESVKRSLRENVLNIISQSDIALNNLNKRLREIEARVRRLPATERNYINIERKYKINNEIYTYMLEKLSEAQIAMASNISDGQVIEEAQMTGTGPVSPKKMMIYAIALLLGLGFPAAVIIVAGMLNTRITSQDEVENLTSFPVIGHIFRNKTKNIGRRLVLEKPQDPASEPFRAIRTKINLLLKNKEKPVISVTSSLPNEGKSYVTINTASSMALINKQVIILDLDLRKSRMAEEFMLDSAIGVVDYIIGDASIDDITFETKNPMLKIIPAGSIPPNPAEMLLDPKMKELINSLKETYDYIFIDSPPVGYVADIYQLYEMIDANIVVVRHKFTRKKPLTDALRQIKQHTLKNVGIVFNAIEQSHSSYGYNYSYSYGYGYGYVHNEKKRKRKNKNTIQRKVINYSDIEKK